MVRGKMVARKVPLLKLREHPKLHWPPGADPNPVWAGPTPEFPNPSDVVLTKVELIEEDKHAARHLTLTGTYHGNLYRTTLTIDDSAQLTNLLKLLGKCRGQTMAEIGAREVDSNLNPA